MSVYTASSTLDSVQDAYNKLADFAFRPELIWANSVQKKKPTALSMRGDVVQFPLYADLASATTELNESVDVDAVAVDDSLISCTLKEYGNAALYTIKLLGTSFLEVDEDIANLIGYNAGLSYDTLVRTTAVAGTNVTYGNAAAARNQVRPTDTLKASDARKVVAALRTANVPTFGGAYHGYLHPHVSVDFRAEVADITSWRAPQVYGDMMDGVRTGSIGTYEGVDWAESPRVAILADAGSSTTLTDVYQNVIMGQDAICKAWSMKVSGEMPRVVIGPQTDKLKRFFPIGWYWLGGHAIYKQESLRRIETASSIGTNA